MSEVTPNEPEDDPSTAEGTAVGAALQTTSVVAQHTAAEVKGLAGEAKESARDLLGEARAQARGHGDEQTRRVADALHGFGGQLSSMASGSTDGGTAAELVDQVSQRVERFATRLDDGGLDGVLADAKRLARTRPGTFLLGAMAAGFVVGRAVKHLDTRGVVSAARPDQHTDPGQLAPNPYGAITGPQPSVADAAGPGSAADDSTGTVDVGAADA